MKSIRELPYEVFKVIYDHIGFLYEQDIEVKTKKGHCLVCVEISDSVEYSDKNANFICDRCYKRRYG